MENAVSVTPTSSAEPILVAIDGPAGSGKSSVSREAAKRLGFGILDTGAAYRALAWAALETGADLDSESSLMTLLENWSYDITLLGAQRVSVELPGQSDVVDVTEAIRQPELSAQVSRVSKHPQVRDELNAMFRQLVAQSNLPGVVVEGRDITTVVAPDAPVRLLLTATAEVRAARRAAELPGFTHEQVRADLTARDTKDAAVVDFFNPAPGVDLIDTTEMNFDQSVQAVMNVVRDVQANPKKDK